MIKVLREQKGFQELEQPEFTHENGQAFSRLDRIYSNHELHEQLDRNYCMHVKSKTKLSDHKAVCFSKSAADKQFKTQNYLSAAYYKHPDFPRQVNMEFSKYLQEDVQQGRQNTAPRRLILSKKAMTSAASAIAKEKDLAAVETRLETIEWAMAIVRAAERLNL